MVRKSYAMQNVDKFIEVNQADDKMPVGAFVQLVCILVF